MVQESTWSMQNKLPRQSVVAESLTGFRFRGVTESTEKDSRSRQEHDLLEKQSYWFIYMWTLKLEKLLDSGGRRKTRTEQYC